MKYAVIICRAGLPDYSDIPRIHYDWEHSVYGNVKEELPRDAPEALGKHIILTHYVDANLYRDVLTGHSVTGILHFINRTPIAWWSKKQVTAEKATHSSEFVAARTCVIFLLI